ncbi:CoA ester lyase [Croceicoccus sp. BE223]|uniref:HpcH/HpaI aldolase/citrate lyase family protein n=1 Tax=Croceicoccus sp. BE223 TaxID=2817716 RepID=UPI00286755D9|nr:CoA ester lyase [Croceicoccus sp. BE223]MDR7103737.1 citrate lyase subunit beta/citryl-CoA lyase [Croceicoccus sp. BE223]
MNRTLRSLLFAPGDNPERIAKAATTAADAVIVDLEDAVAQPAKVGARAALARTVAPIREGGKYAVVRINSGPDGDADIAAAVASGVDAIMVPKVECSNDITRVGRVLSMLRAPDRAAMPTLIALLESARGVVAANEIAAAPRVSAIALGTEDFSLSMGVKPLPPVLDLPVRTIALAAHANSKAAYAIPLSIAAFREIDATRDAALKARSYGCHGGLCIHPLQAETLNAAFAPTPEEIEQARAVFHAWEIAQAEGKGVTVVGDRMVDAPVAGWAKTVLARAESTKDF